VAGWVSKWLVQIKAYSQKGMGFFCSALSDLPAEVLFTGRRRERSSSETLLIGTNKSVKTHLRGKGRPMTEKIVRYDSQGIEPMILTIRGQKWSWIWSWRGSMG